MQSKDKHSRFDTCVNPKLTYASKETVKDFEGCLSIPHYVGVVPRSREIHVAYEDLFGNKREIVLKDYAARIFQHELDHLSGILYIDRIKPITFMHEDQVLELSQSEIFKLLQ